MYVYGVLSWYSSQGADRAGKHRRTDVLGGLAVAALQQPDLVLLVAAEVCSSLFWRPAADAHTVYAILGRLLPEWLVF